MDFSNYKFRCSALGKIVPKKGSLTDTIKTYLQECFIGEVYGVRRDISSKYFEKGKFCEEDGITLLQNTIYKDKLLLKNDVRMNNEYIHGEYDTLKDGKVWDIKNAWDLFTFGKAHLSWEYEWQLCGYAWLLDVRKAGLFYCINNMPEHMLIDEERKIFYSGKFFTQENEEYIKLCNEMRAKHNYDHMPLWERFKIWDIEFTEEKKDQAIDAVTKARKYMCELWDHHQEHMTRNKLLMGITAEPSVLLAERDEETRSTIISKLQKI